MKANVLLPILAVEAMLASDGTLPVNVKFLLEGQEEIGSRDLGPFVALHKELLACDLVVSSDSTQWSEDQGAVILGVKGLCACEIMLESSSMDLHSGLYGGAVPNAAHAIAELLASLHDSEGNVTVAGFLDQVRALSPLERENFAALPYDEEAYKNETGTTDLVGESGYSTQERASARPTLEVNGVWSGYQGQGIKTVIPAKAHAKISCRLVPDQDPSGVLDAVEAHVFSHVPCGATVKVTRFPSQAFPYVVPMDDPGTVAVADVLREHYGREPYYIRMGGSLPITDLFLKELGVYTSNLGMSLWDERFHSPNEFHRLESFAVGQRLFGKLFERLGE
jgi:acetylornithine deacetylase/succinyl-diaminopimelate desuccinylase-like protein